MFNILKIFDLFKKRRGKKREDLSVAQFKRLLNDIRSLTELIEKIWIIDDSLLKRIKKIQKEMDKLDDILNKKYFSVLPEQKKMELKKSLIISKEELIKCIEEAPCPTERKQ